MHMSQQSLISKETRSPQDMQDEIFRAMSADRKLEVAAGLWKLARELDGVKIDYGANRSKTPSLRDRKDFK